MLNAWKNKNKNTTQHLFGSDENINIFRIREWWWHRILRLPNNLHSFTREKGDSGMRIMVSTKLLVKDSVGVIFGRKTTKLPGIMHCGHRKKKCSVAGDILSIGRNETSQSPAAAYESTVGTIFHGSNRKKLVLGSVAEEAAGIGCSSWKKGWYWAVKGRSAGIGQSDKPRCYNRTREGKDAIGACQDSLSIPTEVVLMLPH